MIPALRLGTLLLSFAAAFVSAAPVQENEETVTPNLTSLEKRATIPLSSAQVASYKPYTFYAAVTGCGPSSIMAWDCGAKCDANSAFTPVAAGGDGGLVQYWYVGYDSALKSVIVAFQGTDAEKILPIVTDADFFLTPLRPDLFPGLSSDIQTHNGFGKAQALSAAAVLSAVKTTMSRFGASQVTVVGHSLGGAIATISGVHLRVNLPPNTTFKLVTYGCPRVGNQAFVDFVNSHFPSAVARIDNRNDIVPIVPGRFLGFHHVEGEIHILNDLQWVSCPGQDNTDADCTIGYVPNIFSGDPNDHGGPYDGVLMGCT
ncbi:Lipase [Leucoagaricus sp. SymC.cos]|nr:Lipase [Leucoagaricus sp. SymC.cos]